MSRSDSEIARLHSHAKRIEEVIAQIETHPEWEGRELFRECLSEVLAVYRLGLGRVLELVKGAPEGQRSYEALLADQLVSNLLINHRLHPVALAVRLREALAKVRPYMESHGGNVELIALENEVAHLRLVGHCKNCPSSAITLEFALRKAIEEACPDLTSFVLEGVASEILNPQKVPPQNVPPQNVPPQLPRTADPFWVTIDLPTSMTEGQLIALHAGGAALIFCKVGGQFYAYRDRCPGCNLPLHLGQLEGRLLSCREGHRFDVQLAGRSVDSAQLHLEPLPLLHSEGEMTVALPSQSKNRQPDGS